MFRVNNSKTIIMLQFIGTSCICLPGVSLLSKWRSNFFGCGERANVISEGCSEKFQKNIMQTVVID